MVEEMKMNPLTPTHCKQYAPASKLFQSRYALKSLITAKDLAVVNPYANGSRLWAIGANQKNGNVDRFLTSLSIDEWEVEDLIESIKRLTWLYRESDEDEIYSWLDKKSNEWFQQLYSIFLKESEARYNTFDLEYAYFIRLEKGGYARAEDCFFPGGGVSDDTLFPRIHGETYAFGKNKAQQESAKSFLGKLGVKQVGELEQIKVILDSRYLKGSEVPSEDIYVADLERFINFVSEAKHYSYVFSQYFIFKRNDEKWSVPRGVFIDFPFSRTGLSEVNDVFGTGGEKLSDWYEGLGIDTDRIVLFAKSVGVKVGLSVSKINCTNNPRYKYLRSVSGQIFTSTGKNEDYIIEGLEKLCKAKSVPVSKLIWRAMKSSRSYLIARYRKNESNNTNIADSQLLHIVRREKWVPQVGGDFVSPSDASSSLLPEGFAFDPGLEWIKKTNFGEEFQKNSDEQIKKDRLTRDILGTDNKDDIKRIKEFGDLPVEDQVYLLSEYNSRKFTDLPERDSPNPDRRAQRVEDRAVEAPLKGTETRERSVQLGLSDVKKEADVYLRSQYTNSEGVLICQVCKTSMPFKLPDGSYYAEKVEFIKGSSKRHYQNYLALCPNHSAMFKHANGSLDTLKQDFLEISGNELDVDLAGQQTSIYFTRVHTDDIKAVLSAELNTDDALGSVDKEPPIVDSLSGSQDQKEEEAGNSDEAPISLVKNNFDFEFQGIRMPGGLKTWKKAYVYSEGSAWIVSTRKLNVAIFPSKDSAMAWWRDFSEHRGLSDTQMKAARPS